MNNPSPLAAATGQPHPTTPRILVREIAVSAIAVLVFVGLMGVAPAESLAASPSRQNVLLIIADDLNCAIGSYGDPIAVTPNLDRLASKGLLFERAYCQQAVCNPSRASFLTGLRPDHVGVSDLRQRFRETAPNGDHLVTFPEHFKNQGYFCQSIGKVFHNTLDTQDRRSWSIDESFHIGTHAADTVFSNAPDLPDHPKPKIKSPVLEAHEVPDTAYRDGQIANLAAAVLHDRSQSAQPFFLAVGFWRPHLPFVAPRQYWDLYAPETIPGPTPTGPPTDVPDIAIHDCREIRSYGNVPKDRDFNES